MRPLGDVVDAVIRREDSDRFLDEVRGDDPELAGGARSASRRGDECGAGPFAESRASVATSTDHFAQPGELVEGGQLLVLHVPPGKFGRT
jgi:hypothetical protein